MLFQIHVGLFLTVIGEVNNHVKTVCNSYVPNRSCPGTIMLVFINNEFGGFLHLNFAFSIRLVLRAECIQIRQSFLCQLDEQELFHTIISLCFQLFVCFTNLRYLPWNFLRLFYYWEKQEIESLLFSHSQKIAPLLCAFGQVLNTGEEHLQGGMPALMGKHLFFPGAALPTLSELTASCSVDFFWA